MPRRSLYATRRLFPALVLLAVAVAAPAHETDVRDELRCLALNVYFEARSEPLAGMFAVAAVTLNRVRSPRYPDSVCGVVWQPRQFSWTHDEHPDQPRETDAWEDALWIARVTYEFSHPSNVGKAVHFHAAYVTPPWSRKRTRITRIGRHIFYE